MPHQYDKTWRDVLGLWILGFVLRGLGAAWGPEIEDEQLGFAARLLSGDFEPAGHLYPPFITYVSAVSFVVLFVGGRLLGLFDGTEDFRRLWLLDTTSFVVVARLMQAALGAALGPIAYLGARRLGIEPRRSLAVGVIGAFIPAAVWFAHIVKPQGFMAVVATLALVLGVVYAEQGGRRIALGLGVSAGVAQAYLHSAVMPLFPVAVATLLVSLFHRRAPLKEVFRDAGIAALAAIGVYLVLSVQLLWFLDDFLRFQLLQSQMSLRESQISDLWNHALPRAVSWTRGLNPVGFILIPVGLFLVRDRAMAWFGAAAYLMTLYLASMVGSRVEPRTFLPFTMGLTVLGALAWAHVSQSQSRTWARVGVGALVLLLGSQVAGTVEVLRQAMATPAEERLGAILRRMGDPDRSRILTPHLPRTGIRQSLQAFRDERARQLRLAEKYGVELPDQTPPDERAEGLRGGWYIRETPWVVGGLEFTEPEDVKVVLPYLWPVQKEEWKLDHWLEDGFDIFVLWHVDDYTSSAAPSYVREFYKEILERCETEAQFDVDRPIFGEEDFVVLTRCR